MHIHILPEKITKFSRFPNVIQIYLPIPPADNSLLADRLWLNLWKEITISAYTPWYNCSVMSVVFPFDTKQELDSMILIGPFQLGMFCDSRHRLIFFCLFTKPSKTNHYFNNHLSDAAVQPWVSYRHSCFFCSSRGEESELYGSTCTHLLADMFIKPPAPVCWSYRNEQSYSLFIHGAPKSSQGFGQNVSWMIKDGTSVSVHQEIARSRQERAALMRVDSSWFLANLMKPVCHQGNHSELMNICLSHTSKSLGAGSSALMIRPVVQ